MSNSYKPSPSRNGRECPRPRGRRGPLLATSALVTGIVAAGSVAASGVAWAQPPADQTSNSGAASQAGSQFQSPTAGAPETGAPTTGVAEVVVTAQRRQERLQDVPIAITAVTADTLLRNHIDDIARLEVLTPGFTFGSQGSDAFPAIRGVRTSLVSAQTDPVIGFYVDGVYQSRTQQQTLPLFDVSRVEVQRGPQGTLYGRNTFGGNISVVTNEPTKKYDGAVSVEYGNYNQIKADGFVNIPVNDTLQLRLAAVHISHDGYVHSSTTPGVVLDDDDESAERVSLKWTPINKLQVLLHAGQWARDDAGAGSYGYKVAGTLINPATGYQSVNGKPTAVNPSVHNGTDVINGVDIGVPVTGGAYTNNWDYQPYEHLVENFVSGVVSYDFDFATLRSITGYTEFHAHRSADNDQSSVVFGDRNGFGSGIQVPLTDDHTTSEEVQLASRGNGRFQWIVGGYYLHDDIFEIYQQRATAPGSDVDGYKETTNLHTDAYAGYAQASYFVIPEQLRLIGGIRYSKETKAFNFADYADAPPNTYDFVTPYSTSAGSPSFVRTTYRAGLEYTPTRNNMFYATFSSGFESGGVNDAGGSPVIPTSYAPQTVDAYEIGAKNRLLGGKVEANVSVFYNDFNNLQISVYTPQVSYFGSAGKAFSEGAEFELKTLPLPNFHVDATATVQNAKYTFYTSANNFFGLSNPADPDSPSVSFAGKEIPQTPKVKTTLAIYYDYDLGQYGTVSPYLDTLFSTRYYTTDFNTSLDEQHAYAQLDLSLRWTDHSEKYYVEGYGNNVTDVPVLFSGVVGRAQRIQVSYGPPATYGVRVGAKF